ncbi:MAG: YraN family protein [Clostridia bacterium]|nr:YraN family protein [Clostridia bacterium]MDD4686093.1 YraN family protein [Clostridia bacterium]
MYKPHILGKVGEIKAVKFLKDKGYKILEVNFTNSFGEIDIISRLKKEIVFIEVKIKSNLDYGLPQEEVNRAKQNKIKKGALEYLRLTRTEVSDIRFDVIEICGEKINHIKEAFH